MTAKILVILFDIDSPEVSLGAGGRHGLHGRETQDRELIVIQIIQNVLLEKNKTNKIKIKIVKSKRWSHEPKPTAYVELISVIIAHFF